MNRVFIIVSLLLVLPHVPALAQTSSGVQGFVIYEVVDQLPPLNFAPGTEAIASLMPKEIKRTVRTRFNNNVAITDDVITSQIEINIPPSVFYANYNTGERVSQLSLDRETFLVSANTEPIQWQITGDESEFLGFPTLKAISTIDERYVEAWFTPAIPASIGFNLYHGLPGLILVLTEDGGKRTARATSVSLGPLVDPILVPSRGRVISPEEFNRLQGVSIAAMSRVLQESLSGDD
jgi:GLPGLI family protein